MEASDRPLRSDSATIRPFDFSYPDSVLADLRARIAATVWPERETVSDATQGVQLATVQELAHYWAAKYDWRRTEQRIRALPNFMTEIDGLDTHFIHVRSPHADALPLVINHGWPGTFIEQLKVVGPLADPTAHGGRAEDAFHVVIPSMPGYGFSAKPTVSGWDPRRIARARTALMSRLGYDRYVAQGGDWGSIVTEQMAVQAAPGLLAIHTNMPGAVPADVDSAASAGGPAPANLSAEERLAFESLCFAYSKGIGYAYQQGLRPQTLYGIADSPVGLAAWLCDVTAHSYQLVCRAFAGAPDGLSRDDILDMVTLFWLTNTAISAARLYWENKLGYFSVKGIEIPVAVSVFPDELYAAPRSWVKQAYPNLIHYNRVDKGGHFAAWEQPELFTKELRDAFRAVR